MVIKKSMMFFGFILLFTTSWKEASAQTKTCANTTITQRYDCGGLGGNGGCLVNVMIPAGPSGEVNWVPSGKVPCPNGCLATYAPSFVANGLCNTVAKAWEGLGQFKNRADVMLASCDGSPHSANSQADILEISPEWTLSKAKAKLTGGY